METINKIENLYKLLDYIEFDPETKTLTIDSDITIFVKGEYKLDVLKHVRINSNYNEIDKELDIPYSIFWNSDESEFKKIEKNVNDLLNDCGCK